MKFAIVYSSITGNTELLARKISGIIPKEDVIYFGEISEKAFVADVIFLGFWACKGSCDDTIKKFLQSLARKNVFLFGTAGFGDSEEYFQTILDAVTLLLPADCTLVGTFLCQGKMPHETCLKYRTLLLHYPNDMQIMRRIDNFDRAKSHPDDADINGLVQKIKQTFLL